MKSKIFRELGNFFKERRMKAGLTQSGVAEALGYTTPQFISNMERGLCSLPLDKLAALAALYKIPERKLVKLLLEQQKSLIEFHLSKSRRLKSKRLAS